MRLISVDLKGYRRFADASLNLNGDIIALIGPNEAGKTSLLQALWRIEDDNRILRSDITRDLLPRPEGNQQCISARYLLEDGEMSAASDFGLTGKPRWFVVSKTVEGDIVRRVDPPVKRDVSVRADIADRIGRKLRNTRLRRVFAAEHDTPSYAGVLGGDLEQIVESLQPAKSGADEDFLELIQQTKGFVEEVARNLKNYEQQQLVDLSADLEHLAEWEQNEPVSDYLEYLNQFRPEFVLFGQEDRELRAEYSVGDLADPPDALENLLALGEVDIPTLREALEEEDHGIRAALQETANETLRSRFQAAWRQSGVCPYLQFDRDVIRILVSTNNAYAPVAERSDGLRSFIALFSFVSLRSIENPILLIDEAESHLHYDAQADLIRVFEKQEIAYQIIYTTHSIGCLPNDLGTGVRVAKPITNVEVDTGRSRLLNSFWGDHGKGFSPLRLAIGASLLAFVPARKAAIVEGPADTILLPTLLREATRKSLQDWRRFRSKNVPELDLEAPRVAYLVDGDDGGKGIKRKLKKGGVPADRIVSLPAEKTAEDLVRKSLYVEVVNEQIRMSTGKANVITPSDLPAKGRVLALSKLCKKKGLSVPSKVRVAEALVARRDTGVADGNAKRTLKAIHEQLEQIFDTT